MASTAHRSDPADASRPSRELSALLFGAACAVLLGLALLGIWLPTYQPGQDTPEHLITARVISNPQAFVPYYTTHFAPTSQLFVYGSAALDDLVGILAAAKVVRTICLLLLFFGVLACQRALGVSRGPGALLAPVISANFATAMGFDNFLVGWSLAPVVMAFLLWALRTDRIRYWLGFGVSLVALAAGHAVLATMWCAQLGLLVLVQPSGRRLRALIKTSVAAAPGVLYIGYSISLAFSSQVQAGVVSGLETQRLPLVEQIINLVRCSVGGFSGWGAPVLLVLVGLTLLGHRGATERRVLPPWTFGVATGIWLFGYFAFPFHGAGWAYAQPRLLLVWLLVLAIGGRWIRWPRIEVALVSAAGALYLLTHLSGVLGASFHVTEVVATYGDGPTGRTMVVSWSVPQSPDNPYVHSTFHSAAYAVMDGGASPDFMAFNAAIHAIALQGEWAPRPPMFTHMMVDCDFTEDCADARLMLPDRIAVQGLAYDTILITGSEPYLSVALQARGYEQPAPARFIPHPTSVELTLHIPPSTAAGPIIVRAGYPDTLGWFSVHCRPAGPSGGPEAIRLGPLPAGPTQLEVVRSFSDSCELAPDTPIQLLAAEMMVLEPGRTVQLGVQLPDLEAGR